MKVNVSRILRNIDSKLEVNDVINIPTISFNGDEISVNSPVKVKALITNTEGHLLITGEIIAELILKCSRCLESFVYTFPSDFEEKLSNKEKSEDVIYFEGDTLDLTDIVIDNILLSLPMKVVCNENCKGLCVHCGVNQNIHKCDCTNENVDPRLEVLKSLFRDY